MKNNELTLQEIEKRFAEIDSREPEDATQEDLAAFAAADEEAPEDAVGLDEYKEKRQYSGRLMARIPKDLHRELAEAAKKNGVSLNQYVVYKLAR